MAKKKVGKKMVVESRLAHCAHKQPAWGTRWLRRWRVREKDLQAGRREDFLTYFRRTMTDAYLAFHLLGFCMIVTPFIWRFTFGRVFSLGPVTIFAED